MVARNVLFDLDGTLVDSSEAVLRSLQGGLSELGHDVPSFAELAGCAGRDGIRSFARLLETEDRASVERTLGIYRARHADPEPPPGPVFEGVRDALSELARAGRKLFVVTQRPLALARGIVALLALDGLLEGVHGPSLDGHRASKPELLAQLIWRHDLVRRETVLVGDREHDVLGARAVGIRCLAVTWGYAREGELERSQPDLVCATPGELPSALGYFD